VDLGTDKKTGKPIEWPTQVKAIRKGPVVPTK